jgi:hypothetical protein
MQVDFDVCPGGSIHKPRFVKNCEAGERQIFEKASDNAFEYEALDNIQG